MEEATVKKFLTEAFKVVGNCLYVWGGGWNEEDNAAGIECKSEGISKKWERIL